MAASRALGVWTENPLRIVWMPVYASASFVQGDYLILQGTTTGVTGAAAAGNNFTSPTSQTTYIVGQALAPSTVADGSGTQATWVPIAVADSDVWWQIPMYSATATNAVATLSYVGIAYGGRQVTAGYPAINLDDTSNTVFRLMTFDANDDPGWGASNTGPAYAAGTTQFANVYAAVIGSKSLLSGAR